MVDDACRPWRDRLTRILFVTQTHNVWGGMEQWLHNFTSWLQEQSEWDVRVGLVRGRQFNDPDRYRRAHPHIEPIIIDARAGTESSRVLGVVQAIEQFEPDILVPIGSGATFPAIVEAKRRGSNVRFLPTIRGLVPELMANVIDYWADVDGVVSINRLFDRYFHESLGEADVERIHYVRHGARPALAPHVDSPHVRVGLVGRIEQVQKRARDLIPFTTFLSSNVELHVFGSGSLEGSLRERLPSVIFHGALTQQELYERGYPELDVLLLLSDNEGTPNVVCEAMHHGIVPVIARYLGEAGERFVIHGQNGFTFPIGDVASAAGYVNALAEDCELLRRMAARASQDVAADIDLRMHQDWLEVFSITLALPQKVGASVVRSMPGGRLERLLTPRTADRLRVLFGRCYPHPNGWAEWPGSVPSSPGRAQEVRDDLVRLDEDEQARVYTSSP